jgi:hypothetical protein
MEAFRTAGFSVRKGGFGGDIGSPRLEGKLPSGARINLALSWVAAIASLYKSPRTTRTGANPRRCALYQHRLAQSQALTRELRRLLRMR